MTSFSVTATKQRPGRGSEDPCGGYVLPLATPTGSNFCWRVHGNTAMQLDAVSGARIEGLPLNRRGGECRLMTLVLGIVPGVAARNVSRSDEWR